MESQYTPPPPNESQYAPGRLQYDFENFSMQREASLHEAVPEWIPSNYLEKGQHGSLSIVLFHRLIEVAKNE